MTNPPETSTKPSITDEGITAWLMGEEKVPHEGGQDEVPHEGGEHKVPQEGGEYEGSQQEGSHDKAVAGDPFIKKHIRVDEDAEAGPSEVQQPVCGGDESPELCEYEKLRERNIRERDEAMKEAMEEIEESKQDMRDNAPGAKKKEEEEEARGTRKRKKVEPVVEVRGSGRERKPVKYMVEEDLDGKSRKTRRRNSRREDMSKSHVRSGCGKTPFRPHLPSTIPSSSHTLRPQKLIDYSEVPEPTADCFIWCSICKKEEFNGCEKHATYFGDNKEFKLEVEKSSQGGKAGEGVVNRGKAVPAGVLFGPYTGKFIPAAEYEMIKSAKMESGNAWEIRDKFNMKTVGYIDPGMNPDPQLHWMAMINCPNKTQEQNLVGFQLAGQIYYRVIMDIPEGKELLVWYGTSYAEEMGIDVETIDKYTGVEDHAKEAKMCGYCGTGMEGEGELGEHLGKGEGNKYKCGMKQAVEMVRMAVSGERKYVCTVCGKGFKTKFKLSIHSTTHTKLKAFKCEVEGCSKKFARSDVLFAHKKEAHEGLYHECRECGKRFAKKSNMTRHYKSVHLEEKHYKCFKCGFQFGQNDHLTQHIKTVHDKIRAFKCMHCGKSFGQAGHRKSHMEAVHSHLRYPCTWQGCTWTTVQKALVKYHVRRSHTKEWSLECQLCDDQLDIWWGCIKPSEMDIHKAKKHPVEWEEEQQTYMRDHPYICKYKRCLNRYKTEVEKNRHQVKMH